MDAQVTSSTALEKFKESHQAVDHGVGNKTHQKLGQMAKEIAGEERFTVAMESCVARRVGEDEWLSPSKLMLEQQSTSTNDANKLQGTTKINKEEQIRRKKKSGKSGNREEHSSGKNGNQQCSDQFRGLAPLGVYSPHPSASNQTKITRFEQGLIGVKRTVAVAAVKVVGEDDWNSQSNLMSGLQQYNINETNKLQTTTKISPTSQIQEQQISGNRNKNFGEEDDNQHISSPLRGSAPHGVFSPSPNGHNETKNNQFDKDLVAGKETVAAGEINDEFSTKNQSQRAGKGKMNTNNTTSITNQAQNGKNLKNNLSPSSNITGMDGSTGTALQFQFIEEINNGPVCSIAKEMNSTNSQFNKASSREITPESYCQFQKQQTQLNPNSVTTDSLNLELNSTDPNGQKRKKISPNPIEKNQPNLPINVDENMYKHPQTTKTNKLGTNGLPHNEFPTISTNFTRPIPWSTPIPSVLAAGNEINKPTTNSINIPTTLPNSQTQPSHTSKTTHPPPPTTIQTMATKLRARQTQTTPPIILQPPKRKMKQGCPAVLFNRDDFMVKMADSCKYTLVGKFHGPMPKMEVIRRSFITQVELRGQVKLTHFNSRHIYIDLQNEHDRATVLDSKRLYIDGKMMRILVWTPTFSPDKETPIVPVWVSLPELPWHCYYKEFVSHLLADVGEVLHLDMAFLNKTRGSIAKAKVQMDITKPRIQNIWIGFDEQDDPNGDGKWQEIQYEDVPLYCTLCMHQGHSLSSCGKKKQEETKMSVKNNATEIPTLNAGTKNAPPSTRQP